MSDETSNHQTLVQEKSTELFEKVGLNPEIQVSFDTESSYYTVQIDTDNPGLIIGYRGETLSALQYMLGQVLRSETGEWLKVIINVGDYRQQREETLVHLAENAARRVEFSGEPYTFTNLTPPERRVVHMALQGNDKITTYSQGEGKHRQLVVAPKQ